MFLTNVWSCVKMFLPSGGKVPSMKRFPCGLVILGLVFGGAGQARSKFMYFTDSGSGDIRRANLDGTGLMTLVGGQAGPGGIALDLAGGLIYWTNDGGDIRRANLDGSGQTILVSGLNRPQSMALDLAGGLMYWTNFGNGEIWRAKLDGSDPT